MWQSNRQELEPGKGIERIYSGKPKEGLVLRLEEVGMARRLGTSPRSSTVLPQKVNFPPANRGKFNHAQHLVIPSWNSIKGGLIPSQFWAALYTFWKFLVIISPIRLEMLLTVVIIYALFTGRFGAGLTAGATQY